MSILFILILEERKVTEEWKKITVPMFQNEGRKIDCGKYSDISLIFILSNIFMGVLLNRMKPKIEE